MTTFGLDVASIVAAFNALEREALGHTTWQLSNPTQEWLFGLRASDLFREVDSLPNLATLVAESAGPLNAFLVEHGFAPKFEPIENGYGVAAVLDLLAKWQVPAQQKSLIVDRTSYPAFRVATRARNTPHGYAWSLSAHKGLTVWLHMPPAAPRDGRALFDTAAQLTQSAQSVFSESANVTVPMIDAVVEPDLSWLLGATGYTRGDDPHAINQAFQMMTWRMNEQGAHAKVATGIGTVRCVSIEPEYVINRPFATWFTHESSPTLPLAVLYADTDVWRRPEGL